MDMLQLLYEMVVADGFAQDVGEKVPEDGSAYISAKTPDYMQIENMDESTAFMLCGAARAFNWSSKQELYAEQGEPVKVEYLYPMRRLIARPADDED